METTVEYAAEGEMQEQALDMREAGYVVESHVGSGTVEDARRISFAAAGSSTVGDGVIRGSSGSRLTLTCWEGET